MSLPDGIYTIKEFAAYDRQSITGNGPDKALTMRESNPPFSESQRWKITRDGKAYKLEFVGNTVKPALRGFSWRGENPKRNDPVILGADLKPFTLTQVPGTEGHIYHIRPVVITIGIETFVGAPEGGAGEVQFEDFLPGGPETKPRWEFIPVSSKD